ncbi:UDP-N-acetylmuramate--L-alanine ligase [Mesonia sp. K7]|uniref:UDP-N-acetylmuramate--L-alanine ligase n=1 Tax=Mesonia sp. K7 TaxID=2218606 RepID=UPI000DA92A7B|nr:UDP-N-acetylmuramate--L-alanine ligase [Mesonia sp. K7]PZD78017.1 UDP-N-acetylmuramate--L-alanine ligase [Mesonia sp. K7]
MKNLSHIQHFVFLGIGGIGMSAIARYFALQNKQVCGYDRTQTQLTTTLQNEGVDVIYTQEIQQLFVNKNIEKENTIVIFTPAVSKDNLLYIYFLEKGFRMMKRAQILGEITKDLPTLAVAGTHGKTTTTAILAHILKQCGVKLTAFLGGISENYKTNFISDGNEVVVVEADEFDRSFLQLTPNIAAITSMDADHLDIYQERNLLETSFRDFAAKVSSEDLYVAQGLPLQGKTIGFEASADIHITNIKIKNGTYIFDVISQDFQLTNIQSFLPGRHNLFNATVAIVLAIAFGLDATEVASKVESFKGVERRFTYHLKTNNLLIIEDYAHHPNEISAVYEAARELYPNKKISVIFQPHLYSRTKDFADDFATSLSAFDEVNLLEIYPAREIPIEGINAQFLLEKINNKDKKIVKKEALSALVKHSDAQVFMFLGAGDIGDEVPKVIKKLPYEKV